MMEYQFKKGDRVKLKPLDTLKKYFARGRFSLSHAPKGMAKSIEDGWYIPTEQNYDSLIKLNYTVYSHVLHQVMDICCMVTADTGEYHRYPEGWMERAE
jgi:hypothetical protein